MMLKKSKKADYREATLALLEELTAAMDTERVRSVLDGLRQRLDELRTAREPINKELRSLAADWQQASVDDAQGRDGRRDRVQRLEGQRQKLTDKLVPITAEADQCRTVVEVLQTLGGLRGRLATASHTLCQPVKTAEQLRSEKRADDEAMAEAHRKRPPAPGTLDWCKQTGERLDKVEQKVGV
jgi:chromosome segregation ATPase